MTPELTTFLARRRAEIMALLHADTCPTAKDRATPKVWPVPPAPALDVAVRLADAVSRVVGRTVSARIVDTNIVDHVHGNLVAITMYHGDASELAAVLDAMRVPAGCTSPAGYSERLPGTDEPPGLVEEAERYCATFGTGQ